MTANPRAVAAIAAAGIRALVGARDGDPPPTPLCNGAWHIDNACDIGHCVYCGAAVATTIRGDR